MIILARATRGRRLRLTALTLFGLAILARTAAAVAAPVPAAQPAFAPSPQTVADMPAPAHLAQVALDLGGAQLAPLELARVGGGTCTTCSDGGGAGGSGTGSSGTPVPVGSPYWVTYRVALDYASYTPSTLASKIDNWSSLYIQGTFSYTRKVVRDVQFSGGFASFVRASVGGEVSMTTTASVSYPIPPSSYGKLYVKYYTARDTYYGHQYQGYSDGSRVIVGSSSGPYANTSTVLGYVTGSL